MGNFDISHRLCASFIHMPETFFHPPFCCPASGAMSAMHTTVGLCFWGNLNRVADVIEVTVCAKA